MRYLTQFEISQEELNSIQDTSDFIDFQKGRYARDFGKAVGKNIGFAEVESYNPNLKRYTMEVEVFSQPEWWEFKRQLKGFVGAFPEVGDLLKSLESGTLFNRPPNDAVSDTTDDDSKVNPDPQTPTP